MKIFKRIISIIIAVILVLILSFNIFNFVSIKLLGNELPTINGYAYLEVVSGSMEPKISIGDIVIIDTKVKNYKVKDIVTFKDINGSFVTHRIIKITDNEIITQGDANNTVDDSINNDQIVGRYVYKLDGLGALMKSLRSPLTLVMILIIGVILCILVSTDSKGNVILTEDEKDYLEFLESKKKKSKIKEETENKDVKKKTQSIKKDLTSKIETKKQPTKKTSTTKTKTAVKKETVNEKVETKPKKVTSKKEISQKTKIVKNDLPSKIENKKQPTRKTSTVKTKTAVKKETISKTVETKPKKSTSKKQTNKSITNKEISQKTTSKNTKK